uniref:Ubiquitin-like domain-containing protein n=1 Tax=Anguilla anguilla TaxID=7936 RepID=A0A0E9PM76_ANGAN
MEDMKTLSDYGIQNGSVVRMIRRMSGGSVEPPGPCNVM